MDISILSGETVQIDTVVTNADGTTRDISAATGTLTIWDAIHSLNVSIMTASAAVTDGPNGKISFVLPDTATDTYARTFHVFYYECRLVEASGVESVVESGTLSIN